MFSKIKYLIKGIFTVNPQLVPVFHLFLINRKEQICVRYYPFRVGNKAADKFKKYCKLNNLEYERIEAIHFQELIFNTAKEELRRQGKLSGYFKAWREFDNTNFKWKII